MSRQKTLLEKTIRSHAALEALVNDCSNHVLTSNEIAEKTAIEIFERSTKRRHDLKIILVKGSTGDHLGVFLVKWSNFNENLYFQKDAIKLETNEPIATVINHPQTLNYRTVTGYKDLCDEIDVFERFAKLVKDQELIVAYLQAGDVYTVLLLEWIDTSLFIVSE